MSIGQAAPELLWQPSPKRVAEANLIAFAETVEDRWPERFADFQAIYQWSIEHPDEFWQSLWRYCHVTSSGTSKEVVRDFDKIPGAKWFPKARLNFAENLLLYRDQREALVFWNERGLQTRLTYRELYDQVARVAHAFCELGVRRGDRVAGFMPNLPETVIAMLAAASMGAVWSSCSPDFGTQGLLDRFGQIRPKLLLTADSYLYKGRTHDCLERVAAACQKLPTVDHVVVIPYLKSRSEIELPPGAVLWTDLTKDRGEELACERLPFDHPLYILYSSGTTGPPKCIVHGAGGTLLQHLKELVLHTDLKRDDRIFYFTTCGWMMWNWLVSSLAVGATVVLYDGAPFSPRANHLFDLAEAEHVTVFGTSAKYLSAAEKAGLEPARTHDLSHLRTVLSTGSPLAPESFDYVYGKIKSDSCLSSISGGTDIVSCFALGNPIGPVYRGELQARGLGMKVLVFDEHGHPIRGQKGELVCAGPFPSMPLGFWGDQDGSRYHQAYFERYPGVWHHGDYAELTEHDGVIVHGRSDAVLNPGGVRIGTAEIYRQVQQFSEVLESLAVGQEWKDDERVILFVKLRPNVELDERLADRIKDRIRRNTTPRHVPAKVIQVADLPRTKSGKVAELAVRIRSTTGRSTMLWRWQTRSR